jgi:hypothetical protein
MTGNNENILYVLLGAGAIQAILTIRNLVEKLFVHHIQKKENGLNFVMTERIKQIEYLQAEIVEYTKKARNCLMENIKYFNENYNQEELFRGTKIKNTDGLLNCFKNSTETTAIGYKIIFKLDCEEENHITSLINDINNLCVPNNKNMLKIKEGKEKIEEKIDLLVEEVQSFFGCQWEKIRQESGQKNNKTYPAFLIRLSKEEYNFIKRVGKKNKTNVIQTIKFFIKTEIDINKNKEMSENMENNGCRGKA